MEIRDLTPAPQAFEHYGWGWSESEQRIVILTLVSLQNHNFQFHTSENLLLIFMNLFSVSPAIYFSPTFSILSFQSVPDHHSIYCSYSCSSLICTFSLAVTRTGLQFKCFFSRSLEDILGPSDADGKCASLGFISLPAICFVLTGDCRTPVLCPGI